MNIRYMNQPKEVKLGEILNKRLNEDFSEAYIVSGIAKDSAIDLLEDDLKKAILNKMNVNVYIGVDRKNTSKDYLLKLLDMGASLSININGDLNKIETRLYAFESNAGSSFVYLSGGKFSEGGLIENSCLITEIEYLKEEKKEFEAFKNQMLKALSAFKSVDKNDITLLAMNGEIMSRIIDRKIPSIGELYGDKDKVIGEQVYDEGTSLGIIKDEDFDDDFDIEFDEGISIRKNVELEAEKEAKFDVFAHTNKTQKDLDRLLGISEDEKKEKKSRIVKSIADSDFDKMSTLIIECGKVNPGEIKIQKSLSDMLNKFLNVNGNKEVVFEVLDNKLGSEKDISAQIVDTGKGVSISYDESELKLNEADILRFIKLSDEKYKLEVIREQTDEYEIWEHYLTNTIKGSKRRFGII